MTETYLANALRYYIGAAWQLIRAAVAAGQSGGP